jgi:CHASE3 domain sensor protein
LSFTKDYPEFKEFVDFSSVDNPIVNKHQEHLVSLLSTYAGYYSDDKVYDAHFDDYSANLTSQMANLKNYQDYYAKYGFLAVIDYIDRNLLKELQKNDLRVFYKFDEMEDFLSRQSISYKNNLIAYLSKKWGSRLDRAIKTI